MRKKDKIMRKKKSKSWILTHSSFFLSQKLDFMGERFEKKKSPLSIYTKRLPFVSYVILIEVVSI